MSTVTVTLQVIPEKEAEFLRIFKQVAAIVEADEPDTLIYAVWETGTPHEYFLVESYRTEAGRENHNTLHSAQMAPFIACHTQMPQTQTLGKQVLGIPN